MKVNTVTGDPFDYLELTAESAEDCCSLLMVSNNTFIRYKDRIELFPWPSQKTVVLRVRLSEVNLHNQAINGEQDAIS